MISRKEQIAIIWTSLIGLTAITAISWLALSSRISFINSYERKHCELISNHEKTNFWYECPSNFQGGTVK
jgi:hypothetical protein